MFSCKSFVLPKSLALKPSLSLFLQICRSQEIDLLICSTSTYSDLASSVLAAALHRSFRLHALVEQISDLLHALFADKGGDPNLVRESQRRRYADITLVDKVVELDTQWRDGALLNYAVFIPSL